MNTKPVIFLTFANDRRGEFLEALSSEREGINLCLSQFQQQGGIVFQSGATEPKAILDGLNQFHKQLCIYHFSGHGDGIGIKLESLTDQQVQFHGANLSAILATEAKANLKLVFLNACLTEGLVESLQAIGVPAIIATETVIPDKDAKDFAIVFYNSLLAGKELGTAFHDARIVFEPDMDEDRIYRGFFSQTEVTKLPWGLHVLEEDILQWKLTDTLQGVKPFPQGLQRQMISATHRLVNSLKQELKNEQKISVSEYPEEIIKNFGWLIEAYLLKMLSPYGNKKDLYAFSFMTEAWNSSLRYLCYIQIAQLLQKNSAEPDQAPTQNIVELLRPFLDMDADQAEGQALEEIRFDYLQLLFDLTSKNAGNFVPQIHGLMEKLLDSDALLHKTTSFLQAERKRLLIGETVESELETLMPQYLTALTYWLRKISFLAHYSLVSIKDINVNYRLGTGQRFDHLFGELHGIYSSGAGSGDEKSFKNIVVDEHFTYNQSILLMKGKDVDSCMQNIHDPSTYLSLSPLLIDQGAFDARENMTPEVFYFIGQGKNSSTYHYAKYNNDLPLKHIFKHMHMIPPYKTIEVSYENEHAKLNEFYEHVSRVFESFYS